MTDRRTALVEAGLDLLREEGLAGFTQARVAARVGLKQGNVTYYFPTRTDLLVAVAGLAMEAQLSAVARLVTAANSIEDATRLLAAGIVQHDNSRVISALTQAADQEPELRVLYNQLLAGFVAELAKLCERLGLGASEARLDMLHGVLVGLAAVDLATNRENAEARARAALTIALSALAK